MSLRVVFRADASVTLGQGHIMRCLALAQELRRQGAVCSFICLELPGHLIDTLRDNGFTVRALDARHKDDWVADARASLEELGQDAIDWIIVDHYSLDYRWERQLKERVSRLMVIDDLANRSHDCDLLLDQNLGRKNKDYLQLVPSDCQLLLGPSFALLREEFLQQRRKQTTQSTPLRQEPAEKLLISMGGTDAANVTGKLISLLEDTRSETIKKIIVILGAHAPWADTVRNQAAQSQLPIEIMINPEHMAEIMDDADLAIGAGGVSALERCCIGLPSLLVVIAPNQLSGALELDAMGAAKYLGDIDAFETALFKLIDQGDLAQSWERMAESARELVDGEGCARVAFHLLQAIADPLRSDALKRCEHNLSAGMLRPISEEDMPLLFAWRNHPDVRRFMRQGAALDWEGHQRWFRRKQATDELPCLFEIDGVPLGFIQFDDTGKNGTAEWGFYIAPDAPKGTGRYLGVTALSYGFQQKRLDCIIGRVLPNNLRSLRFHELLGFKQTAAVTDRKIASDDLLISFSLSRSEWTNGRNTGESHEAHC